MMMHLTASSSARLTVVDEGSLTYHPRTGYCAASTAATEASGPGDHRSGFCYQRPRVEVGMRPVERTMLALTVGVAAIAIAADYEKPPTLPAKDIVPAAILSGKGYTIDAKVPTDGLLGRYTIRSAGAGLFPAHGLEMLSVRVSELPAIQQLQGMSRSKVFLTAARGAAEKPVKAAVNIVTHPKETLQGIPAGVGRFFDRVQSGASRMIDAASSGPDEDRAGTILKGGGTAARDALGYEQERRALAKELK